MHCPDEASRRTCMYESKVSAATTRVVDLPVKYAWVEVRTLHLMEWHAHSLVSWGSVNYWGGMCIIFATVWWNYKQTWLLCGLIQSDLSMKRCTSSLINEATHCMNTSFIHHSWYPFMVWLPCREVWCCMYVNGLCSIPCALLACNHQDPDYLSRQLRRVTLLLTLRPWVRTTLIKKGIDFRKACERINAVMLAWLQSFILTI